MNRNAIIRHIELYRAKLGSMSAVARRANVSPAAISTLLAGKYGANEEQLLGKIAAALDYRENNWQVVRTLHNYATIERVVRDARSEAMWFCISNPAGSSKTATLEDLYNRDHTGAFVFIQAEEWTARQFLSKLIAKTIGEKALEGRYRTIADMMDMVVGYFNDRTLDHPVLVIGEADKLRPAALRTLIPLFNRTEDRLGVVLSGTENLQKEITAGVRLHKKGYDELESRFGRSYITLRGANRGEVEQICRANGLKDEEAIARVWGELDKTKKLTRVKTEKGYKDVPVEYAEDFRRIKRVIKRELLKQTQLVMVEA